MAESSILARLKEVDPQSYWHLTTLAKAPTEVGLHIEHDDDGGITVSCTVCQSSEHWGKHEWMPDLVLVHHKSNCLLMTPIDSKAVH